MRIKSAFLVFVAVLVAGIGYFVLLGVRGIAEQHDIVLSRLSAQLLQWPAMIVLLTLPAAAAAIIGARATRHTWIWLTLTTFLLLIPVAIVLYCFVQVVGSMYQYQQL